MLEAGHGLAAPQVGSVKRLFVYDAGLGPRCVINPEIIDEEGECTFDEGCLSLRGVTVPIVRPSRVQVRYTTPAGHKVVIEPGGFLSRVFQHEIDHLDGLLIVDRCSGEDRRRALADYQELEMERRRRSGV